MKVFWAKLKIALSRSTGSADTVFSLWVRLFGLVYLAAFVSIAVQALGLFGERGILPVAEHLEFLRGRIGPGAFWTRPSLSWFWPSDAALVAQLATAIIASIALISGRAVTIALWICWMLHLSLIHAGGIFFYYQWDTLLSEAGFIACFLGTWNLGLSRGQSPAVLTVWALRWLLFRLMFGAGWVKVFGGDAHWTDLTALEFHFETQPLPTWAAWYFHHLPDWLLRVMTAATLFIELLAPFFIFMGRVGRRAATALFMALMSLIALTGNYGPFNLLAMLLCLALLDDRDLPDWIHQKLGSIGPFGMGRSGASGGPPIAVAVLVAWFVLSASLLAAQITGKRSGVPWLDGAHQIASNLRVTNLYGLFARMTTERDEIILEGSSDGVEWKSYQFRFKPDDPWRAPGFNWPHQPRLDWQFWFASLGRNWRQSPWVLRLARKLLEGSGGAVEGLFAVNPFPTLPPKWIRARICRYHFADPATKADTGQWWVRGESALFMPPVSLREADVDSSRD